MAWPGQVDLKVFTGGVLRWGKKEGRVMWGKSVKEQYDPNMTKKDFTTLQCKFQVLATPAHPHCRLQRDFVNNPSVVNP